MSNDEQIRVFQVGYSIHRRRDRVQAATASEAAQQVIQSVAMQLGITDLDDIRINTVIEHGIDAERACAACEAKWKSGAHNKPEDPPPRGAPPTGGPTGGTTPTLLQEAA